MSSRWGVFFQYIGNITLLGLLAILSLNAFPGSGELRSLEVETTAIPTAEASTLERPQLEAPVVTGRLEISRDFVLDGDHRRNVDFWVRVYTQYYGHQGLVHDTIYPDIIYEVLDLRELTDAQGRELFQQRREHWRGVLKTLNAKGDVFREMTADENHVTAIFSSITEPRKYLNAAQAMRMRMQVGMRDRFAEAVRISGRYLPLMEEVFQKEGLPIELTRLPFVESGFNIRALSKVGASGIWQFMPSTGKRFMRIDAAVDERNDPVEATRAAARLLRENYEALRSWPLAVVAYNHGREGMARAVRQVGSTRFEAIASEYKSPSFGFASRNFYPSLVAAIEVERDAHRFFGRIERESPSRYVEVGVADFILLKDLCAHLGIPVESVRALNPALTADVTAGTKRVPRGYRLRIPADWGRDLGGPREAFWMGYLRIPSELKHRTQLGNAWPILGRR